MKEAFPREPAFMPDGKGEVAGGGNLPGGRHPKGTVEEYKDDTPELAAGVVGSVVLCCFLVLARFCLSPSVGTICHRKASSQGLGQILVLGGRDSAGLMLEEPGTPLVLF